MSAPREEDVEALPGYWDIIEAALTALPETYKFRSEALASFDHLKERVTQGEDEQKGKP